MKKAFLLLAFMFISIGMKGQDLVDVFTYELTKNEPLVYNKTLNISGYTHIYVSLPFADHLYINGMHLEFTISKENVLWYFGDYLNDGYYDLHINVYDGTYIGWPDNPGYVSVTKIIRIIFDKERILELSDL